MHGVQTIRSPLLGQEGALKDNDVSTFNKQMKMVANTRLDILAPPQSDKGRTTQNKTHSTALFYAVRTDLQERDGLTQVISRERRAASNV